MVQDNIFIIGNMMSKFSFEICKTEQVEELVEYIDNNWSKNHILVKSRELLDWQHKSHCGTYYNFIMVRDNADESICGVLGFIPTSHFSDSLAQEEEVWLAIWKVNEGSKYIGLGLGLLNYLKLTFGFKKICSIGISQIVFPMYQALGYKVGKLSQFALINDKLSDYKIIECNFSLEHSRLNKALHHKMTVINPHEIKKGLLANDLYASQTKKNSDYFIGRFINHPVYSYEFLGFYHDNELKMFAVARVVEHDGRKALRIVDAQGDYTLFRKCSGYLYEYVLENGYEFVDIMQEGIDESVFLDSGFMKIDKSSSSVVPNYFEPFVKENIEIYYARRDLSEESFVLFRGDADQDRPNILLGETDE
ncbi:hypothetical protein [Vibrio sp. SCSIO 43137]|uniref:hypothetical protein n=1 Tax=Vibrio sp. SCSIO 43137 TaxID=3021011 RepID=UPI00230793AF|nr:hypothetical protein [Vibrio sp. SCSIO 43137]WCE29855.1 hypothetical protein PK654_00585 [Vibrio sp. SCSIO 43137]